MESQEEENGLYVLNMENGFALVKKFSQDKRVISQVRLKNITPTALDIRENPRTKVLELLIGTKDGSIFILDPLSQNKGSRYNYKTSEPTPSTAYQKDFLVMFIKWIGGESSIYCVVFEDNTIQFYDKNFHKAFHNEAEIEKVHRGMYKIEEFADKYGSGMRKQNISPRISSRFKDSLATIMLEIGDSLRDTEKISYYKDLNPENEAHNYLISTNSACINPISMWKVECGFQINAIAFSSQPIFAIACNDGYIKLFNYKTYRRICAFSSTFGNPLCVAFSHDSRILAAGFENDVIMLYDMKTYNCVYQCKGHHSFVKDFIFCEAKTQQRGINEYRAISVGLDGRALLWEFTITNNMALEILRSQKQGRKIKPKEKIYENKEKPLIKIDIINDIIFLLGEDLDLVLLKEEVEVEKKKLSLDICIDSPRSNEDKQIRGFKRSSNQLKDSKSTNYSSTPTTSMDNEIVQGDNVKNEGLNPLKLPPKKPKKFSSVRIDVNKLMNSDSSKTTTPANKSTKSGQSPDDKPPLNPLRRPSKRIFFPSNHKKDSLSSFPIMESIVERVRTPSPFVLNNEDEISESESSESCDDTKKVLQKPIKLIKQVMIRPKIIKKIKVLRDKSYHSFLPRTVESNSQQPKDIKENRSFTKFDSFNDSVKQLKTTTNSSLSSKLLYENIHGNKSGVESENRTKFKHYQAFNAKFKSPLGDNPYSKVNSTFNILEQAAERMKILNESLMNSNLLTSSQHNISSESPENDKKRLSSIRMIPPKAMSSTKSQSAYNKPMELAMFSHNENSTIIKKHNYSTKNNQMPSLPQINTSFVKKNSNKKLKQISQDARLIQMQQNHYDNMAVEKSFNNNHIQEGVLYRPINSFSPLPMQTRSHQNILNRSSYAQPRSSGSKVRRLKKVASLNVEDSQKDNTNESNVSNNRFTLSKRELLSFDFNKKH